MICEPQLINLHNEDLIQYMPSAKNDKRMTLEQYATKYKTAFIEHARDTKIQPCQILQNSTKIMI